MNIADRRVGRLGSPPARERWARLAAALGRSPGFANRPVMAATTGGLFIAGGVFVVLSTAGAGSVVAHPDALRSVALSAVAVGVAVLAARHRIPVGAYQLLVLLSTALTSCAVWLAGPASALALASMYAFVVIDCIFFSWLAMVRQVVALLVGAGIAFAATDVPIGWRLLSMSSAVSVAVVVSWLIRRADEAETDALTTLLNRRGFDRSLDEAITRAGRDAQPLSLALLDLDHFKQVNDSLGHGMGDQLLVSVTRAWAQAIRPGQVLARLGGDEFAVIMPGEPADAARTVQRLRSMLPGRRTCSAGLALHEAGDSRSMLVGRADAALYDAKRGGRDRIGHSNHQAVRERDLRGALSRGELFLDYQPVVALPGGRTVGLEALVRWRHPQRGVLPPGSFLPRSESSQVVHDLGDWVATHAFAEAAAWRAVAGSGTAPPRIAVNVAGPELRLPGYAGRLRDKLGAAGLPPAEVVLEVTETTLDADAPEVVATLHELRQLGVAAVPGRLRHRVVDAVPAGPAAVRHHQDRQVVHRAPHRPRGGHHDAVRGRGDGPRARAGHRGRRGRDRRPGRPRGRRRLHVRPGVSTTAGPGRRRPAPGCTPDRWQQAACGRRTASPTWLPGLPALPITLLVKGLLVDADPAAGWVNALVASRASAGGPPT